MKTELIKSMPEAEHHAIDAASASRLKAGAKSWKQARYAMLNPPTPTPAMRLGTFTHAAILEPDKPAEWIEKPDGMSFATKEGKAWREAHAGTEIVTADDAAAIRGMKESVWANPDAARLLSLKGYRECSLFDTHPETGMPCKARLDFLAPDDGIIVDIKTCECARPFEWERQCAKFGYFLQAAFYLDAAQAQTIDARFFYFIVVEKAPPYECVVYQIGDLSVEKGRKDYARLLWEYKQCVESGVWPGYFSGVHQFDIPRWALNDEPEQDQLIYSLSV